VDHLGHISVSGVSCELCGAGNGVRLLSNGTLCETCAATHVSISGVCHLCPSGRSPDPSQTQCRPCQLGYAGFGGRCAQCEVGFHPSNGSSFCVPCPFGMYKNLNMTECQMCLDGEQVVDNYCQPCPSGMAGLGGKCTQCPSGRFPAGASITAAASSIYYASVTPSCCPSCVH
jgi:hypothetical protein